MERLDFTELSGYNATECAIHLNRYLTAKPYVAGKRVLDVACGEGYGSKLLKDWGATSVVGVDISAEALQIANSSFSEDGITFLNHSAEQLPFESDSFDVVVSFETIEHLEHPEVFLSEIARVVKFNGTVILSCPNDNYYAKNLDNYTNPYHLRRYSWSDFRDLAEKYLGSGEQWFFGFSLKGFTTVPLTETRIPKIDDLPQRMTALFDYSIRRMSLKLNAESCLNSHNACYYLGIWGDTKKALGCEVFYPEELFLNHAEDTKSIHTMQNRISLLERQCISLKEQISSLNGQLRLQEKEIHKAAIEKERVENLRCVAETEKQYLWRRINVMEAQIQEDNKVLGSKIMKPIFLLWRVRAKIRAKLFGRK